LTLEIISPRRQLLKHFLNPTRNPWELLAAGARRKKLPAPHCTRPVIMLTLMYGSNDRAATLQETPMTTPKHPQLTVNLTMNQITTLRQALHALRNSALTIAATEKEFSRGRGEWLAAEYRAMENEARIDSAARALDAAILPLNEWEALTDDLEAVRALKTDFDFAASENERLAGAVLPSMKGGRHE
jgi:hypothetical protein